VNGVERRRRAAALLILAWTLALHAWIPALLAIAFVSWIILHKRLESDFGDALARRWRRGWPPGRLVLILLLACYRAVPTRKREAIEEALRHFGLI
jgi:uncharacterized BrkB/YihY/UPF0761 family membrane protein